MINPVRLLFVGEFEETHVGRHLWEAACSLSMECERCDSRDASATHRIIRSVCWRFLDRRPPRLNAFSQSVVAKCRDFKPTHLITTGFAPVTCRDLMAIQGLGIGTVNYLTDDPWNPASGSAWLKAALLGYDHVFSPRRSNLEDLSRLGIQNISYLPFAYAPSIHYPADGEAGSEALRRRECDVLFIGGADRDRVPMIESLMEAGFDVGLYGLFWERFGQLRSVSRGRADSSEARLAVAASRMVLALVRRANRDGHTMRTFEAAAMKGCLLAEDTEEQREILGNDGAMFFTTGEELVCKAKMLLENREEREAIAVRSHARVLNGKNTYVDRLLRMIDPRRTSME